MQFLFNRFRVDGHCNSCWSLQGPRASLVLVGVRSTYGLHCSSFVIASQLYGQDPENYNGDYRYLHSGVC